MTEAPTATEENHIWIDNGEGGQTNLNADIAAIISRGRSGNQPDIVTAANILAHPAIEEAVSQWPANNEES